MTKKELYLEFLKKVMEVQIADFIRRDSKPPINAFLESCMKDSEIIADSFTEKFSFLVSEKENLSISAPNKEKEKEKEKE